MFSITTDVELSMRGQQLSPSNNDTETFQNPEMSERIRLIVLTTEPRTIPNAVYSLALAVRP